MDLQLHIDEETCIKCSACTKDCPYFILEMSSEYPAVKPDRASMCIQCQHCLAVCPTGSLSILGYSPEDSLPIKGVFPSQEQMDILIRGRRSTRRYKSTPLDTEVIDSLLETIAYAPTGVNSRQCLFSVVEDPEVMQAIRLETIDNIRTKMKEGTLPEGMEFFSDFVKAWDEDGRDVLFRFAPHMLLVSSPVNSPSPDIDPIIALSYFELLAASMQIGTLWDGLAKWAFTAIAPEMLKKLGIPEDHKLGYVMLFGKPAVKYFRTVQRKADNTRRITW